MRPQCIYGAGFVHPGSGGFTGCGRTEPLSVQASNTRLRMWMLLTAYAFS